MIKSRLLVESSLNVGSVGKEEYTREDASDSLENENLEMKVEEQLENRP